MQAHGVERGDDGEVADAVNEEAVAFAGNCDHHAGERRTDQARHIDHGRIQRDGVTQILFIFDHFHEERLAAGHVKRIDRALQSAKPDDFVNGDAVAQGECGEREGLQHRERLRDEQNIAAIQAVHPDSGEGREKKCGDLSREADDAQQERRAGEAIDEPAGREARHPRAHQRNALSTEVQAKISVAQRAPGVGNAGQFAWRTIGGRGLDAHRILFCHSCK